MIKSLHLFSLLLILNACEKENLAPPIKVNPKTKMSLEIKSHNDGKNYTSKVKSLTFKGKDSHLDTHRRELHLAKTISVSREISFEIVLANGEKLSLTIWMHNHDVNTQDVIITNLDQPLISSWDFKNFETEKKDFYLNCERRVIINESTGMTSVGNESSIVVKDVEKVIVDGMEKSMVTLAFSGESIGWYSHKDGVWYEIKDGVFKGVIE
jgi:hypothetical protein